MTTYIVEFSTIHGPQRMRTFGMFEAADTAAAIDAVQSMTMLRHDMKVQCDIYLRDGSTIGRKVWSGLHRGPVGRPRLVVVA